MTIDLNRPVLLSDPWISPKLLFVATVRFFWVFSLENISPQTAQHAGNYLVNPRRTVAMSSLPGLPNDDNGGDDGDENKIIMLTTCQALF